MTEFQRSIIWIWTRSCRDLHCDFVVTTTTCSRACLTSSSNPCTRYWLVALSMQQQLLSRPTSSIAARPGPQQAARASAALRLPHASLLCRVCAHRSLVHRLRQPTLQGTRGARGRRVDLQASASSNTAHGMCACSSGCSRTYAVCV